jgi:hypothetical protein
VCVWEEAYFLCLDVPKFRVQHYKQFLDKRYDIEKNC